MPLIRIENWPQRPLTQMDEGAAQHIEQWKQRVGERILDLSLQRLYAGHEEPDLAFGNADPDMKSDSRIMQVTIAGLDEMTGRDWISLTSEMAMDLAELLPHGWSVRISSETKRPANGRRFTAVVDRTLPPYNRDDPYWIMMPGLGVVASGGTRDAARAAIPDDLRHERWSFYQPVRGTGHIQAGTTIEPVDEPKEP